MSGEGIGRRWYKYSPEFKRAAQLRTRISELERLNGKQAAELDFFAAALRSVGDRPEERRAFRRGIYQVIQNEVAA